MPKVNWSQTNRSPEQQMGSTEIVRLLRGDFRIEAYVPEELYARFNQKCSESGLDPSDMLTEILKAHFSVSEGTDTFVV